MRAREQRAVWLRWRGGIALLSYLVLLFYAHVHVVLEAHEHGAESAHAEHHEHDSDHAHEHDTHPAADHSLAASTPGVGKAEPLLVHDLVSAVETVFAPVEKASPVLGWIEGIPKHPPPRLPEQPRSPPIA